MRRLRNLGIWMCAALVSSMAIGVATCSASNGVAAWGENYWGQLGTGGAIKHSSPTTLSEPTGVTAVAAGGAFSLALLENATVKSWGSDVSGQLGNGAPAIWSPTPLAVKNLGEVKSIAAGSEHALALLKSGGIEAWGANALGQLGLSSTTNKDEPVAVPELTGVTAISAQGDNSLALKEGKVFAWGDNEFGQLGMGTTSGPEKCGSGKTEHACSTKPVEVHGLEHVIAIAAGRDHNLALLENGQVWAWGYNYTGGLGDGTTTLRSEPVKVEGLSGKVLAIAAGWEYSLALIEGGTVKSWGANTFGTLGDGSAEGPEKCGTAPCSLKPVKVTGLSKVTVISAAERHSLALSEGESAKAWGINEEGALGDGRTEGPEKCLFFTACSQVPIAVDSLTQEVVGVAAGGYFGLAYGPSGPVLSKIMPTTGLPEGGTSVELTGRNFTSGAKVSFGSNGGIGVKVESPTKIVVSSPTGSGKVQVTVTTTTGIVRTSLGKNFRYAAIEAPEIGLCEKVAEHTGKYSDAACTVSASEGSYVWTSGVTKPGFTLSGGAVTMETVEKQTISCTGVSGEGEYTSPKEADGITIKLTGCTHSGSACSSSGAAEGELITSSLEGELGWRNKTSGTVGLDLAPTEAAFVIEGTCGASQVHVRGSVIAAMSRNAMSTTGTLTFEQSGGKQKPGRLVEGELDVLETLFEGRSYEQTGLAAAVTLKYEESLEINSAI